METFDSRDVADLKAGIRREEMFYVFDRVFCCKASSYREAFDIFYYMMKKDNEEELLELFDNDQIDIEVMEEDVFNDILVSAMQDVSKAFNAPLTIYPDDDYRMSADISEWAAERPDDDFKWEYTKVNFDKYHSTGMYTMYVECECPKYQSRVVPFIDNGGVYNPHNWLDRVEKTADNILYIVNNPAE